MKSEEKQKQVLFAGSLYGNRLKEIVNIGSTSHAIQKYNSNIVDTLRLKYDTCVLSPVQCKENIPKSEIIEKTIYHYIKYRGQLGRIKILISGCLYNLKMRNGVIVADALNVMLASGLLFLKKAGGNKVILIVTDIPEDVLENKKTFYGRIFLRNLDKADGLIFLTEQANRDFNAKRKPYAIVEGIVSEDKESVHKKDKISIYAGGLEKKNNIKLMVDAFENVAKDEECLCIFGDGDPELKRYIVNKSKISNHIRYMGTAPNKVVLEFEYKAKLLINPRTNSGAFTKYSFPSKFIEYLNSGTPALVNRLDGIPDEYYDKVLLFSGQELSDYEKSIRGALDLSNEERLEIGEKARAFIQKRNGQLSSLRKIEELVNRV